MPEPLAIAHETVAAGMAHGYYATGPAAGGDGLRRRRHGERVEDPIDLPAALGRALRVVKKERRQALLNVICR